ncbi:MAG: hypothetical protein ABI901_12130 [Roseiflexaceae bacterium]
MIFGDQVPRHYRVIDLRTGALLHEGCAPPPMPQSPMRVVGHAYISALMAGSCRQVPYSVLLLAAGSA